MNNEAQLKLQAYLDGELPASEIRQVEEWLASDRKSQLLLEELRATRLALRDNEPQRALPVTHDFHWSQIQRAIERGDAAPLPPTAEPLAWLVILRRWLVPVSGLALVLLLAVAGTRAWSSHNTNHLVEIENLSDEVLTSSFRYPSEKVVVFWLTPKEYAQEADWKYEDEPVYQ